MKRYPYRRKPQRSAFTAQWLSRLTKLGAVALILALFFLWNRRHLQLTWTLHRIERAAVQGDFDRADHLINLWRQREPDHPSLQELAGFVAIRRGDVPHGAEAYARALAMKLSSSRAIDHLAYGTEYLHTGQYRRALAEFQLQTQLRPRQADAWHGLAVSWHGIGSIQKAIDLYKKALFQQTTEAHRAMLDLAINQKRRGGMTYMTDRRGQPLAQWRFGRQDPLYMSGYHTAHILGYAHPRFGLKGLEAAYRDTIPGGRLMLSIDLDLQYLAEEAFGARRGCMIVMNSKTGEILAMVNRPTFNPNRLTQDWNVMVRHPGQPLATRATEALYEPGSIAKIMTAAAWLEEEHPASASPWPFVCEGHLMFGREKFDDWRPHGRMDSLARSMDESCNIGFAKAGLVLGPQTLKTWAEKFGFNEVIPFDLPVTPSKFPNPAGVDLQTAELSAGLGKHFEMTPFQALMILEAVANNGTAMVPTLVKAVHGVDGTPIKLVAPTVWRQVMGRRTAQELQRILIQGVTQGISVKAAVPGLTIGGKTGTSGSSASGFNAWFGCFTKVGDTPYTVLVCVEHGGMGMSVAAPIAHKFFVKVLDAHTQAEADAKNR